MQKKVRNLVTANCDHVIFIICSPRNTETEKVPFEACSGYLTAALNTGHTMMFTFTMFQDAWEVIKTNAAKDMLKINPIGLIEQYGEHWFFCKSKPDRVAQCEGIHFKDLT